MTEITLSNGIDIVLIDYELRDILLQKEWHLLTTTYHKYAYCWNPYPKQLLMHRLIMGDPKGKVVDHINRDGLDNRRENLRIVTQSINAHNAGKMKSGTSKFKGVHFESGRGKWKSTIMVNREVIFLGRFDDEESAALAYQNAKNLYLQDSVIFGEEAEDIE